MKKQVVLILGMHRSGTSMLTQVLEKLGYSLGAEQLGASEHNVEGHFERNDVIALDTDILHHFGMEWFSYQENAPDLLGLDSAFLSRAQTILDELLSDSDWVAIKEPRMCLTLPVWQQALKARDVEVKYVFIYRHPKSVALSLQRRNNIPIENGQALWLYYNQSVLEKIDQNMLTVNYDEMVNQPETVLSDLCNFLGIEKSGAQGVVKKAMRHHTTPDGFSKQESVISQYYESFCRRFSGMVTKKIIAVHLKENSGVGSYLAGQRPLKWHSQIFFNLTKSYTEKDSSQYVLFGGKNTLTFDLSVYKKIYGLRFDPHMNHCRFKLFSAEIRDAKGRAVKFDVTGNADSVTDDAYTFSTDDPQVCFNFRPQKLKSFRLTFELLD